MTVARRTSLSPYLFYELLGYPLPLQKEAFAYDLYMYASHLRRAIDHVEQEESVHTTTIDTQNTHQNNEDELSREDPGYVELTKELWSRPTRTQYLEDALPSVQILQRLGKVVPFIEAIYLVWPATYNAAEGPRELAMRVVADVGRVWIVTLWMKLCCYAWNLRAWMQPKGERAPFRCTCPLVFDRTRAHLGAIKYNRHDVTFVYQLAHAVPIYYHHEEQPFPLYVYNRWIKDYLPNFPCRPIISLGIPTSYEKNITGRTWTYILSGKIGDLLEATLRWISTLYIVVRRCCGRQYRRYWHITKRHIYASTDPTRKKIALKRKVYKSSIVKGFP